MGHNCGCGSPEESVSLENTCCQEENQNNEENCGCEEQQVVEATPVSVTEEHGCGCGCGH